MSKPEFHASPPWIELKFPGEQAREVELKFPSKQALDLSAPNAERTMLVALLRHPIVDETYLAEKLGLNRTDESAYVEIYGGLPLHERPALTPYFDSTFYLLKNPDVAKLSIDPLFHFISVGIGQLRQPHQFIDLKFIAAQDPAGFGTVRSIESLLEILQAEAISPSPYFDMHSYRSERMSPDAAAVPALKDYLEHGIHRGISPNSFFIPQWYCDRYPDVPADHKAAILHFVTEGDFQGRFPGPDFDPDWYLSAYPEVRKKKTPPLLHFLVLGVFERRPIKPVTVTSTVVTRRENDCTIETVTDAWGDPFSRLAKYQAMKDRLASRRQMKIDAVRENDVRPISAIDPVKAMRTIAFPSSKTPRVSILIPVYNEFGYTVECLASVAQSKTKVSYEVIVADDASEDPEVNALANIANLRYLRQASNVGFLNNCNAAFKKARGAYIFLLNNDAQITLGCIDRLVAVLDECPNVAAVGPKIIYPNGRLQEAGCHISQTAASTMVGLFHDPDERQYSYDRSVHYCSGAALLVRRNDLDGTLFDEQFAPAYCEDVDLCLRLIAKGKQIRYCASASVIHHLSVSTAKVSQIKKMQAIALNQQKLQNKWEPVLEDINKARVVAFYLPQFHPIPENDLCWGKGFTEWRNVTKARPNYTGHYQPHLPADLGFYDLRLTSVMGDQYKLARRYGIEGFCVYYYNFGSRRILETPLELLVADPAIPFRFCVCWANENWTKHWDGGEKEILLSQDYSEPTLRAIAADFVRYSKDSRYIRVNGKPLFLVYRPLLIPDPLALTQLIRNTCADAGTAVHLVYVESMEAIERGVRPEDIGFDACVEFPPQGIGARCTDHVEIFKDGWNGFRYSYEDTVINAIMRPGAAYKRYPGVFAGWDNTPRQPLKATSFDGVTPEAFQFYVEEKLEESLLSCGEERFLFVNAWNEWAEGAHLEPDQRYGHQWLEALRGALLSKAVL